MQRLGAKAGTQNIDRILRLPGTTNLPNAKKRKEGRVACQTKLLWFDDVSYPLDAFPKEETGREEARQEKPARRGWSNRHDCRQIYAICCTCRATSPLGTTKRAATCCGHSSIAARRRGIDENEIVDACLDEKYRGCAIHEHVRENGGEDYIKRQIERAINSDPLIDEQKRSIIRIEDGKLDEHWRAVQRELINRGCPVYVRGNRLVQPLWRWEKADDREVLTARFERYNVPRLADMVAHRACKFQKYDGRKSGWKDIDPPDTLIERIIEAQDWEFSHDRGHHQCTHDACGRKPAHHRGL